MIEMAETASVAADSAKKPNQDDAVSSPSETLLKTKSTDNLILDTSLVSVINKMNNNIIVAILLSV